MLPALALPNPPKVEILDKGAMGFGSDICSNSGRVFFRSLFLAEDSLVINPTWECICPAGCFSFMTAETGSELGASETIVGN